MFSILNGMDNNISNALNEKCKSTDDKICYDLIYEYRTNNDYTDIDWKLLQKLYIKLCNNSFSKACFSLGNLYTINNIKAIKTDLKKSAEYNNKACELGNMPACNNLGVMYRYGKFYKKDYKKALELFTKSCVDKNHSAVLKACRSKEKTEKLLEIGGLGVK